MPIVPVAQREAFVGAGPSNAGVPQLPTSAPAEAFGGGAAGRAIGQSFGQLGEVAAKIGAQEREKANDTATTDYYTKLAQKKQELFYDPKNGVITKKGKDSFPALDDYGKQFDDYANSIEQGLNAEQLGMAKRIRAKEKLEFDGQILRHTAQESDTYKDNTVKAGMLAARNDAILSAGDYNAVQDKIKLQEAIYQQTASGKPAALVELEMKDIRSKTHAAVIDRMIDNGADLAAKSYFEKAKGELAGPELDTVEKQMRAGSLAGESQRQSDAIYTRSKDMAGAFSEAQKIQDPQVRDETTKRLKDLYSMKELVQKRGEENNFRQADKILAQFGDTNKIPRSLWNSFTASDQEKLKVIARHKREGTQPVTNWSEYYNLKTMAASPELRNEFQRVNLMTYRDRLADTEFKDLVNAQEGLRKGDEKTQKLLDGVRTDQEIINTALKKSGVDPYSKKEKDAEAYGLFRQKVDEKVIAAQERSGKKITSKELEGIVDELMIEGVTQKGWFWDTKKRKYQLQPGDKFDISVDKVPPAERQKIEAALQRRGIKPTDEKIQELYSRKAGL